MQMLDIGFGSLICADKIVAVVSPDSSPIKRTVQEAREGGRLIDATYGRKTESVIITQSDHVILCALGTDRIAQRISELKERDG